MARVVGHIDLDYFYAQVEEVEDPSLRARPVLVCVFSGRTENSGVVSTANYKAREFGVHSGTPIVLAKKKLEDRNPAIIRMEHEKYEAVSDRIMEELRERVDILEPSGIDEAFFDLTSSTGGDYTRALEQARLLKGAVFERERLTSSVGLGRSKVVAKLCSDKSKPNGLKVVTPEKTRDFLDPLPVTSLYGIGPKTAFTLDMMGIKTVGDLAGFPPPELEKKFGRKFGTYLLAAATGTDDDPVRAGLEPTQFSRIVTLKRNTKDPSEAFGQLSSGVEYVHSKLVTSGKSFRTVTAIGILTDLSTRTKSKTFENPVTDPGLLRDTALSLFQELSRSIEDDYRRVGIRVSGLSDVESQGSLSEFLRVG